MRVTIIGCSPAWPNAGGAQSGYLVEGGGRLLLDCGPGVLARLRNGAGGWPEVDAIVITHFHLDHWGDLVPWTFGATFGPGRTASKPELWLPPGGSGRLRSLGGQLSFTDQLEHAFELREYRADRAFTAAGFAVTPVALLHYEELTFGMRVADGSRTVAYSGDTAPTPRLAELARDADLFLCEATLSEPEPAERGHLTDEEATAAFHESGARRLVALVVVARCDRHPARRSAGAAAHATARRHARPTRRDLADGSRGSAAPLPWLAAVGARCLALRALTAQRAEPAQPLAQRSRRWPGGPARTGAATLATLARPR